MSDIAITPADVFASQTATKRNGIAAVAIAIGQALYKDATGKLNLADAASASPANTFEGIALTAASAAGQPVIYVTSDPNFIPGCALSVGDTLYLSPSNAGGITKTPGDLATGNQFILLGICNFADGTPSAATSTINLNPTTGGIHA